MGDRIENLPVDQIVPSLDEKQILESMFVASQPPPTATSTVHRPMVSPSPTPSSIPPPPPVLLLDAPSASQSHHRSMQSEIRTAFSLTLLFLLFSIPHGDTLLGSMIPFLRRSDISRLVCKALIFMMVAYLMLNWEILRASPITNIPHTPYTPYKDYQCTTE